MAYVPFSPELAAAYTISGPDGTIAVLNNQNDANAAGVVTDLTGLDSPDVLDSGGALVQADGGFTGTNWYGRRPITMTIQTYGYPDAQVRAQQITRLRRATNAMRADGILSWTNTAAGSVPMYVPFRRQQPLRVTGGWVKTINLALVSYIAPILGGTMSLPPTSTSVTAENQGDYTPGYINFFTVAGPIAGTLTITNTTTGEHINFLPGLVLSSGQTLTVQLSGPYAHTAYHSATGYVNNYIDFVNSTWCTMRTGLNTYTVNTGKLGINYSSAWI